MEKVYLKNVDTGLIKTLEEWKEDAIQFFTNKYNEEEDLQEDFETLQEYLEWTNQQGYYYTDLIECDENGNELKDL